MKKTRLLIALGTLFLYLGLASCKRNLEVQEAYPFKVSLMPIPKAIENGQRVELRFSLKAERQSDLNTYRLRYFQYDGTGSLQLFTATAIPMKVNDYYSVLEGDFKLFYTSHCDEQQTLELVFEDNHQQRQTVEINFNNKSKKNETQKN